MKIGLNLSLCGGAGAKFDPLVDLDNIQLAIFPHLSRTVWQADRYAKASVDTNVVAQADSQGGNYHVFAQSSGGREPVLGSDSTYSTFLDFSTGAGVRKFLESLLTTAAFNFFHNERTWSIAFPIFPNNDGVAQAILTNARATGTDTGLFINRNSSNRLEVYLQNGTSSSGRNCNATLTVAQGWQVVILTCNAGALTVEVGNQASENHTFTVSHATNPATSILRIGAPGNTPASDTYLQSKLAWLLVTNDVLSTAEKTKLRNWKPGRSSAHVPRVLGSFNSLGFKAISHCRRWFDFSDKTKCFQTTVASAVPVTAPGDPLGGIVDKAPTSNSSSMSLGRNAEYDGTASKRPIFEAAAINGTLVDLPVWDGKVGPTETGTDDELVVAGSGDGTSKGAKTQVFVYVNRDNAADINSGSHIGKNFNAYWVVTSIEYQGSTPYANKRFVYHGGGSATLVYGNEAGVSELEAMKGNNIIEVLIVRRDGNVGYVNWNGANSHRDPQTFTEVLSFPGQFGPAVNPGFQLCGALAHVVEYGCFLPDSYITDILIPGLQTQLGVSFSAGAEVASSIKSVTTDASTTPTTTHITLEGSQNAVRIWTGAQGGPEEAEFDLYVSANGATAKKVRLQRYTARIIACPVGARVSLGTSSARTLKITGIVRSETTETPSGATGTANCDHAGPPMWTPTAAHVVLPAKNSAFIVNSAARRILFISEFDGTAWTPERFYVLEAGVAKTIRATYQQIALANYDGAAVTVTAPTGSTIGGSSATMTFGITKTGTTHTIAAGDEAALRAAFAVAVAGDEIIGSGTYTLTANITDATFAANELAGRQGAEGVIIRSASGNPADFTIIPNSNVNGWALTQVGAAQAAYIKGVTFNIASRLCYMRFIGGIFRLEDCRITGESTSTTAPSLEFNAAPGALNFKALRVQVDDSVEDCFDGNGTGSDSAGVSLVQLIDCKGFDSGTTNDNQQVITTHNGLRVEVWGGEFYDSRLNVVECDSNATSIIHCFFANFHDGLAGRRAGMGSFTAFYCENESGAAADGFTPKAGGYAIGCNIIRTANAAGNSVFRYSTGAVFAARANRITANDGRAIFPSTPGFTADWNVVVDAGEGLRVQNSSAGSAIQTNFYNNTINSCPTALSFGDTNNIPITMYGCATKGSTNGISTTAAHEAATTHNYNTIDPTIDADFVAAANDTVSGDAALDSNFIPTASGNCDDNGHPSLYDFVGGIDIEGLPVIYKSGVSPRGGRSRPIVRASADLYPDVWY